MEWCNCFYLHKKYLGQLIILQYFTSMRPHFGTSDCICWGCEGDKSNWTVRCQARLILLESYSLDLPRSGSWRTILDCEMPSSPDTLGELLTGFAEVVKVTNHTGQWDVELAWYSWRATHWICLGRECDEPLCTLRCWVSLILSECCFRTCFYDLEQVFEIQPCLIVEILESRGKFLEPFGPCNVINSAFTFCTKYISLLPQLLLHCLRKESMNNYYIVFTKIYIFLY